MLDQKLDARLEAVPGGQQLVVDGMPGATATRFSLHLDVPGRSLVSAPGRCGNYELIGHFTSHAGGSEDAGSRVSIGGCPGARPSLSRAALRPRTVRRGRATTLSFWLSERASVRVTRRRLGTRRVRTVRRFSGRAGRNRVRGLSRRLAPGRYRFTIRASNRDGSATRGLTLRVSARRS